MEYTPIASVIPTERPAADKASAYGLAPVVVDGNDVDAVRTVAAQAVDTARGGGGPALIEADTYRLKGHSVADGAAYRPTEEVERWALRDPLVLQRARLHGYGVEATTVDEVDSRVRTQVNELTERALAAGSPDPSGAWTDVWSDGGWQWRT
jgi:pyruvate dehydrogenase E1 component alpha subunit